MTFDDPADLDDLLECIEDIRRNGGEMDLPILNPPFSRHAPRWLKAFIRDLRAFGYTVAVTRDSTGRMTSVRLLEQ